MSTMQTSLSGLHNRISLQVSSSPNSYSNSLGCTACTNWMQIRASRRRKNWILWLTSYLIMQLEISVSHVSLTYVHFGDFVVDKVPAWMIFWNASALKTANVFVLINSFAQL